MVGLMIVLLISIIVIFFAIILCKLNDRLKIKISSYKFHLFDDIKRNYDVLIIGDEYPLEEFGDKSVYKNCLKNRSLYSSYLILRERFSLLREDEEGIVYIVANRKYLSGLSPIDYVNFHKITCSRLHCFPNKFRRKFPIISFLLWHIHQELTFRKPSKADWDLLVNQIGQFCNERMINYKLIIL